MSLAQKILAVKLRAIGDTVIWTAALQNLRTQFPNAEIHTLTYASNAAVLENHPAVNHRHYLQTRSHFEFLRQLLRLRSEKMDWLLGFHATTSLCRWAWLVGAQKMALHHHSWRKTPRGSVLMPRAGILEDALSRDGRVLEAMGITVTTGAATKIWLSARESASAEEKIRAVILRAGGDSRLPRYIFLPGAGHHLRRYPMEKWLPLAVKLRERESYQPVVVVDQALSRELNLQRACAEARIPLLDNGSLREFMALVSRGERALANDSGPGHMAVALGLKTSFVFGPGCVGDWHPYDKTVHPLFRLEVPCRSEGPRERELFQYCTVQECSHHRCLRDLQVDISQ